MDAAPGAACYPLTVRIATTVLGSLVGLVAAAAITLSQAETKTVSGVPSRVVAGVNRGHAYETPLLKRLLWVGIPAGVVGAGIGYFATSSLHLGAAFLGALVFSVLAGSWRESWPEKYGRAGQNAKVSDTFLIGLAGGLFGAAGAARLSKKESAPDGPQPSEPRDLE